MTSTKRLQNLAERLAEKYLRDGLNCVVTMRAVRTRFQRIDIFGSDVVGKLPSGAHVYVQVTTGDASCACRRRQHLASFPWHPSDTVLLLRLTTTKDGRKVKLSFKVQEYGSNGYGRSRKWSDWDEEVSLSDADEKENVTNAPRPKRAGGSKAKSDSGSGGPVAENAAVGTGDADVLGGASRYVS